eukprot:3236943-Pleurochrysis_carterae.AAC.1
MSKTQTPECFPTPFRYHICLRVTYITQALTPLPVVNFRLFGFRVLAPSYLDSVLPPVGDTSTVHRYGDVVALRVAARQRGACFEA